MPTMERIAETIRSFRKDNALSKVSVFGSYADGRATENSDLDLLVEFDTPSVSLIQLNMLKYDLEDALGLPVDIVHVPLPKGSLLTIERSVQEL